MAGSVLLESDDEYGYDLSVEDETLLNQLITNVPDAVSTSSRNPTIAVIAADLGIDTIIEEECRLDDGPASSVSYKRAALAKSPLQPTHNSRQAASGTVEKKPRTRSPSPHGEHVVGSADFTDLTAGTWCELQYFYTLTRLPFGRKTRTAAMKQGTKVHQDLEDEVHTTVRVEIASRVDGFGLRIWNIIQGLRTLREMGMTRELEVWGFVDGNLVNGVIDGLSYKDPDPELAERLRKEPGSQNQVAITDFFPSKKPSRGKIPRVYLTDVKTRGTKKVPNSSSLLWPAKVQLSLYQRFLSEMAADKLDYLRIFRRYNLDPDEPFSDSFIAQIGTLHEELFEVESSDEEEYVPPSSGRTKNDIESDAASDHSTSNFIKYTTLREVLPLLVSELKETFPHGSDSVGRLLEVEYRYRGDGSLIANQTFTMDDHELDHYLGNTMEWWRADREPKGVQIEEAYKCRMCEFADDCTWRSAMDEERLQAVRQRLESRSKHVTASGKVHRPETGAVSTIDVIFGTMARSQKDPEIIELARTLENTPWCEEYEKMISGMMYNPVDPILIDGRHRSRCLARDFNEIDHRKYTADEVGEKKAEILQRMLGKVGEGTFIEAPFIADYGCNVIFGKNCFANFNLVTIGDRVQFGPNVSIYGAGHDTSVLSRIKFVEYGLPVRIEDDCWIGGGVIIMPGVTIGKGTTVGSGAIVTKSLPPYSVAVGSPAKVIKTLQTVEEELADPKNPYRDLPGNLPDRD
nr:defects in morphology protein 1 [Colletotrichum truncatum]KAF6789518.1 defects in morphology protein 1 [Colletotrichum truncatum]